jgi:putative exporter of polyketide antibiotics
MTDHPPSPGHKADANANPSAMPRWVKMLIVVGASLVLLMLALHLTGLAPIGHGMAHRAPGATSGPGQP